MENNQEMRVIKRDGLMQFVSFDKILERVKKIGQEAGIQINYTSLVKKVIDQLYDKISTTKIDELTAEQCASLSTNHPDYGTLAGRIVVSNHQKNTDVSFYNVVSRLYNYVNKHTNKQSPLVSEEFWNTVNIHKDALQDIIDYDRDYLIDYFGFKTLERAYLFKIDNEIVERPQHLWLRVSIGIHGDDFTAIKETYDLMSQKYFTHATPTLFNAGTPRPQNSSCFLLAMEDDSIDGIFNTLKDCAHISKWSGGIGLHIHNIRSKGSHIQGTNGISNGLIPMLRVFNNTARYIDQGGKRNGSFAIYLEPWHADVEDFLEMKKNQGDEEKKGRDLFYALWIPDLFMERIKENKQWSLFCPAECPGLADVYGSNFTSLYTKYEAEGKQRKTLSARELWFKILDSQMETGTPYLLYKDAANLKSNQKNLGTIKSSNLCVAPETMILTDKGHIEIKSLQGQKTNVWNGQEFSEVEVFQTGQSQKLIEVHTSDGCCVSCTPYHKFFIRNFDKCEIIEAHNLKNDDIIIDCKYPIIDGTEFQKYNFVDLTTVPSFNSSLKYKLDWLVEYCDAHKIEVKRNTIYIESLDIHFLVNIKYMLQTCGINPKLMRDCWDYTHNKMKGSLFIMHADLYKLLLFGLNPKIFNESMSEPVMTIINFIRIEKVVDNGRIDDTYCFTEPKRNAGIFNGLLTSQCTEIMEYSDDKETAVCNLASIALPAFVNDTTHRFDYEKLHHITKVITSNLNKIIDVNFYPTDKTRRSNLLHRPIGIGVQGLADVFIMMDIAYHSEDAKQINKLIFETIYHASLERSNEIAIERNNVMNKINTCFNINFNPKKLDDHVSSTSQYFTPILNNNLGIFDNYNTEIDANIKQYRPIFAEFENLDSDHLGSYSSFENSPTSKGILQFDMWNICPDENRYDWNKLKQSIIRWGIRNSLLVAPMPTASTSQILGYNECFEPLTSNIYSRKTLAGEFIVVNKYLMKELIGLGLWNENIKNNIIANKGSIQQLTVLSEHIRNKYKIVWEMPMKHLIDLSADRGAFICQSQSLNLWLEDPNYNTLTSMHFYSWKNGLKTGIYYLRRKPRHNPQQFTIEPEKKTDNNNVENDEICEMCSA